MKKLLLVALACLGLGVNALMACGCGARKIVQTRPVKPVVVRR